MNRFTLLCILLILCSILVPSLYVMPVEANDDSWESLAEMPTLRGNFELVVVNGKIFAIGGSNSSQRAYFGINEMFDPVADVWTTKEAMPTPRSGFAAFVFQEKIYCVGGYSAEESYLDVNEVYDPVTDSWEVKASMPTPRSGLQTVRMDGKIYFLGGAIGYNYDQSETVYSQANEVYDPTSDSWELKASVPVDGEFDAYAFDEEIYCVFKDTVWAYHTEDDSWTQKTSLPTPAVYNYHTVKVEDKIHFLLPNEGGYNQIYHLKSDTWSHSADMPTEVNQPTVVATSGNFAPSRIYVVGGLTGFVDPVNTTYVYDPADDAWSLGAPMPTSRYNTHIIVVNDILYALGGAIGFQIEPTSLTPKVERYTPAGWISEFPLWIVWVVLSTAVTMMVLIYRRRLNEPVGGRR